MNKAICGLFNAAICCSRFNKPLCATATIQAFYQNIFSQRLFWLQILPHSVVNGASVHYEATHALFKARGLFPQTKPQRKWPIHAVFAVKTTCIFLGLMPGKSYDSRPAALCLNQIWSLLYVML